MGHQRKLLSTYQAHNKAQFLLGGLVVSYSDPVRDLLRDPRRGHPPATPGSAASASGTSEQQQQQQQQQRRRSSGPTSFLRQLFGRSPRSQAGPAARGGPPKGIGKASNPINLSTENRI